MYIHMYACVRVYVCTSLDMYVYTDLCIHIYIYTYIHVFYFFVHGYVINVVVTQITTNIILRSTSCTHMILYSSIENVAPSYG